jgi:hypothetical protein
MQAKQSQALALMSATILAAIFSAAARADWIENFDSYTNETFLSTAPGWTLGWHNPNTGDPNEFYIRAAAAYTNEEHHAGNGVESYHPCTEFQYALAENEIVRAPAIVSISFKFKYNDVDAQGWAGSGEDIYFRFSEGATGNGFSVQFNGNERPDDPDWNWGQRDNSMLVSSGGASVDAPDNIEYGGYTGSYGAHNLWDHSTWYTVSITNIWLSRQGEGTNVVGMLNMCPTDSPSTGINFNGAPLADIMIRAAGIGHGAFDKIDTVTIGKPKWLYRQVFFDDFEITHTLPPPEHTFILIQ